MITTLSATTSASTPPIVALKNLSVQRGEFVLCHDVSFELYQGEIAHLVGENGLGKTTLLMQLMGMLPIVTGAVEYLGQASAKGAVYVGHQAGIHELLNVAQNLRFLASLYQLTPSDEEIAAALSAVGLSGYQQINSRELSAGQSRRVGLAKLWLVDASVAPLWVLDEPLTALDVAMVDVLLARIHTFAKQGGTVLLTSHQPLSIATKTINLTKYIQRVQDE